MQQCRWELQQEVRRLQEGRTHVARRESTSKKFKNWEVQESDWIAWRDLVSIWRCPDFDRFTYCWAPNHFQHYWGTWQKPVETTFFTKNNARSALGGTGADHGKWQWERDSCCEVDCCRELSWKNADSDVVLADKRLEDDAWLVRCRPRRWRGRHVILLHSLKLLLPTSLQKFLQSTSSMWSFQDQGPWWAC